MSSSLNWTAMVFMSEGWRALTLGDVIVESREKVRVEHDGEYPLAGVLGFGRGVLFRDPVRGGDISAQFLYRIQAGQLVYSRLKAFEGAFALVPSDAEGRFVSNEFPTFDVDASVALPEYLALYLARPRVWQELEAGSEGMGARRERLQPNDFLDLELDLPTPDEQERVLVSVGVVDSHLRAGKRHQRALRKFREALWSETWESLMDDGAELLAAEDVADVRIGGTPSRKRPDYYENGTIPWLKTGEIRFTEIADTSEYITEEALACSSTKLIPAQTVVMAMKGQGATRGRVGVLTREMATNEAVAAFVPQRPLDPRFLFHWFWSQYGVTREAGEGTSQPNLNSDMVRALDVLYVDIDIQRDVAAKLDRGLVSERAFAANAANAIRFRSALIEELLTGMRPAPRLEARVQPAV